MQRYYQRESGLFSPDFSSGTIKGIYTLSKMISELQEWELDYDASIFNMAWTWFRFISKPWELKGDAVEVRRSHVVWSVMDDYDPIDRLPKYGGMHNGREASKCVEGMAQVVEAYGWPVNRDTCGHSHTEGSLMVETQPMYVDFLGTHKILQCECIITCTCQYFHEVEYVFEADEYNCRFGE